MGGQGGWNSLVSFVVSLFSLDILCQISEELLSRWCVILGCCPWPKIFVASFPVALCYLSASKNLRAWLRARVCLAIDDITFSSDKQINDVSRQAQPSGVGKVERICGVRALHEARCIACGRTVLAYGFTNSSTILIGTLQESSQQTTWAQAEIVDLRFAVTKVSSETLRTVCSTHWDLCLPGMIIFGIKNRWDNFGPRI